MVGKAPQSPHPYSLCALHQMCPSPGFSSPQSTSELGFSVVVEDVNCLSYGVICRKSISISVGSSLIIFDDDSGDPVRPCTGEGCTDS